VKHSRFNIVVVLVLLAAFLLVQADLPISQAAFIRAPAAQQCCCSMEMQKHGACCCCSMGAQSKSGCSVRASHCGENEPSGDTVIVIKFQFVLPVLTAAPLREVAQNLVPLAAINVSALSIEPPVPPPRLLAPA